MTLPPSVAHSEGESSVPSSGGIRGVSREGTNSIEAVEESIAVQVDWGDTSSSDGELGREESQSAMQERERGLRGRDWRRSAGVKEGQQGEIEEGREPEEGERDAGHGRFRPFVTERVGVERVVVERVGDGRSALEAGMVTWRSGTRGVGSSWSSVGTGAELSRETLELLRHEGGDGAGSFVDGSVEMGERASCSSVDLHTGREKQHGEKQLVGLLWLHTLGGCDDRFACLLLAVAVCGVLLLSVDRFVCM